MLSTSPTQTHAGSAGEVCAELSLQSVTRCLSLWMLFLASYFLTRHKIGHFVSLNSIVDQRG